MAGAGIIIPVLTEFNDKGVKQGISSLKKLATSQLSYAAAGTALLDLSRRSIKAAMEDAAAQKQLSLALTNTTGATLQQQAQVEKNIAIQEQVGCALPMCRGQRQHPQRRDQGWHHKGQHQAAQ